MCFLLGFLVCCASTYQLCGQRKGTRRTCDRVNTQMFYLNRHRHLRNNMATVFVRKGNMPSHTTKRSCFMVLRVLSTIKHTSLLLTTSLRGFEYHKTSVDLACISSIPWRPTLIHYKSDTVKTFKGFLYAFIILHCHYHSIYFTGFYSYCLFIKNF